MKNIRVQLAQLMTENADPVGVLDELRKLFDLYAQSVELDDNVKRAYFDAASHLDRAADEFRRRSIR